MIEFDETLTKKYNGKEAIRRRINVRLSHRMGDIPYYTRAIDLSEFMYGSQVAAIKLALRDFGPDLVYDNSNSRIKIYDINIDVSNLGE